MTPPVDVIGLGVASAAGSDPESFFESLRSGRSGAAARRDLAALGIRGAQLAAVRGLPGGADPLLHAIRSALLDAGSPAVDPARLALVVGTSAGGMVAAESFFRALAACEMPSREAALAATYHAPALAAARALGIQGPVEVVSAACASSVVAVGLARDLLLQGDCDIAIAAGHDAASLFVHAGFDALGALSPTTCRPFRRGRDGLLAGEGAGAVVLAPHGGGRRPRARVTGFGASCDATHVTAPDREGVGLAAAISSALADAGVGPSEIAFVSAHGTGTPHADPSETRALHSALGPRAREIPTVSWKPVLGHAMGAAGVLELAGAVLALERGLLPGTQTSGDLDPECDLDVVAGGPRLVDARVALKVSSGFGGANAALVLERA